MDCTEKNVRVGKQTCSPSVAKFVEIIEGETMMSVLENFSTREDAFAVERTFL